MDGIEGEEVVWERVVTIVFGLKRVVNCGECLERVSALCIVEQNFDGWKQAFENCDLELSLLVVFLLLNITGSKQ